MLYIGYAQKYPTFASIKRSAHSHWPRPDSFGLTFDTKKKRVLHLKVVNAHVFFIVYMVLSWRKLKRMDEICIVFRQWFRFSFLLLPFNRFRGFFCCCFVLWFSWVLLSFLFWLWPYSRLYAQSEIYSFQRWYWLFVALTKGFICDFGVSAEFRVFYDLLPKRCKLSKRMLR